MIDTQELTTHWQAISPILTINTEADYDRAVNQLNDLLDQIGTDEAHPLYNLLDTLGVLIEAYEADNFEIPEATGIEVLMHLMQEHNLKQSDLAEIGSQGVVSEVINGKRQLNLRQIHALAARFGVAPSVFL